MHGEQPVLKSKTKTYFWRPDVRRVDRNFTLITMPYIGGIVTVLLLHQSSDQIIIGKTHWGLAVGNITKQILVTKMKDDGDKIVYKNNIYIER